MLDRTHLGRRVVVRRTADVVAGRRRYTDVIGDLIDISEHDMRVRRDDGAAVTVPLGEVVAAKPIPPKPVSYRQIAAVEAACARGWPATETHRLGGWLLRASGGWTNRANTVLPLGDPGIDLPRAIAAVVDWYAERDLPPGFAVPLPLGKRVAAALTDAGWHTTHTVAVQLADISAVRDAADPRAVAIDSTPSESWLAIAAARKGGLPPQATHILGDGDRRGFASIRRGARTVAIGRVAVEDGLALLSLVEVDTAARRQGLAQQVVAAMAGWADDHGADRACVQVESDNAAALALYARLGFRDHHSYVNMRLGDETSHS